MHPCHSTGRSIYYCLHIFLIPVLLPIRQSATILLQFNHYQLSFIDIARTTLLASSNIIIYMYSSNLNGFGGTASLGLVLTIISGFIEHWEVDRLNGLSSNLGGGGLGFVASDGVGSEVVSTKDGRNTVRLPLAAGSLGGGFALARHLLPLLEAAQAGSVAHLLADGRPRDGESLLLDHLGKLGHLDVITDLEMFTDEGLENLRLGLLPASLDVVGVDFAILVAARVCGAVDHFL